MTFCAIQLRALHTVFLCCAGVSRLRARQGGFAVAPLTPSPSPSGCYYMVVFIGRKKGTQTKKLPIKTNKHGCTPKVSKGRSESPLVASAEANPLQQNKSSSIGKFRRVKGLGSTLAPAAKRTEHLQKAQTHAQLRRIHCPSVVPGRIRLIRLPCLLILPQKRLIRRIVRAELHRALHVFQRLNLISRAVVRHAGQVVPARIPPRTGDVLQNGTRRRVPSGENIADGSANRLGITRLLLRRVDLRSCRNRIRRRSR